MQRINRILRIHVRSDRRRTSEPHIFNETASRAPGVAQYTLRNASDLVDPRVVNKKKFNASHARVGLLTRSEQIRLIR